MLPNATCHPDRKQVARGLCDSCYHVEYRKENKNVKKATCHPNKGHYSKGLCYRCYCAKYQGYSPLESTKIPWKKTFGEGADRAKSLWSLYKLTPDEYNSLLEQQQYRCAICGRTEDQNVKNRRFAVDHDHETGLIRGILCHHCNSALGQFGDNVETLEKAIEYLKNR